MKKIHLGKENYALVDDEDFDRVSKLCWHMDDKGYARTTFRVRLFGEKERTRAIRMHRFVLREEKGIWIDHRNRNRLDNQKNNLRICNPSLNKANGKVYKNNRLGVKGVRRQKSGRFSARLLDIWLGTFDTLEEASAAFKAAHEAKYGEFSAIV